MFLFAVVVVRKPSPVINRDLSLQDGWKTQEWVTKKCRARPGMHSLARPFFRHSAVLSPLPSCNSDSVCLQTNDDRKDCFSLGRLFTKTSKQYKSSLSGWKSLFLLHSAVPITCYCSLLKIISSHNMSGIVQ